MRSFNLLRSLLSVSVFAIAFFATAGSNTVQAQTCPKTDEETVVAIVDAIKADSVLAPQLSHIVVGSVNKFVKLQGWTDNSKSYLRLMDLVRDVGCPTAINVNRFEETPPPADSPLRPQPGGCGPGTKQCGDVCIPEGDTCSAKGTKATD
ncbi:MAG TPA: hypothetical protein PLP21_10595 [Pyrinomonadaceae bacterium]|nr:hypothetical protein [Pyrinomonadaceae bacterium]